MADSIGGILIGSAVKGATSALVSKYIERVINPFLRNGSANYKLQVDIKSKLLKYIKSVEYRTRTLPSIAIPSGVFLLEDVYEPLLVRCQDDGSIFTMNAYPRDLFDRGRCVAITDEAGMGKSTLAKFIVRSAINESKNIPIFIELRRLRSGSGIMDCLCQELSGGAPDSAGGEELRNLFSAGNFLFVFDGYDEIEDDLRGAVTDEINEFSAKFKFCYFLLTSRKEYGSALFPEFEQYEICKMNKDQAHSLIKRYDKGRGLAKNLISKSTEAGIDDFMGNPLLVTLLYKAFNYRQVIPPKRGIFFRQVYEALFQDHDLSKGGGYERTKECGLDIDDFNKYLRSLGFLTIKSGRISYSAEEFCEHLEAAAERSALTVDWKKVKLDLIRAVPVFVKDGVEYRWVHKSFQEFFAANYITFDLGSKREDLITKMFNSDQVNKFRDVLRFIAEADVALIRDVCIEPLLSTLIVGEMDDRVIAKKAVFEAADIFYIGDIKKGSKSEFKISFRDVVKEMSGIDVSDRICRTYLDGPKGYAVLVAYKTQGLKYSLLASLDPEFLPAVGTSHEFILFNSFRERFGGGFRHINRNFEDLNAFDDVPSLLGGLARAAKVPVLSMASYEKVADHKNRRAKAAASAVLDGF